MPIIDGEIRPRADLPETLIDALARTTVSHAEILVQVRTRLQKLEALAENHHKILERIAAFIEADEA